MLHPEVSNRQLLLRMQIIEQNMIKIQDDLPNARTGTVKSQWLIDKWWETIQEYAEVVQEAAKRGLIIIH